jgi:hypothetical protein
MVVKQQDVLEVESLARTYQQSGPFAEPYIRATFLNLDTTFDAQLDINGIVTLPPRIPIIFDCKGMGQNVSNIQILLGKSSSVVVYWTQYSGFQWNQS